MIERYIRKEEILEFEKFCRQNNIREPQVFLDRRKSDNLTQSLKCEATERANVLGINLFRVHNYDRLHIVDKPEFESVVKNFEESLKYKGFVEELESIIKSNNRECEEFALYLNSRPESSLAEISEKFIQIRSERAITRYSFEIYQNFFTELANSILKLSIPEDRLTLTEAYYRNMEIKYGFTSTSELLETRAHNKYVDLLNTYRAKGAGNIEFKQKLEDYYVNFYNLDFKKLDQDPKTRTDLLEDVKRDKRTLSHLKHDFEQTTSKKKLLLNHAYYGLKNKDKHLAHTLEVILGRVDFSILEESWGRQVWTRLNLAFKPYYSKIEQLSYKQGLLRSDQRLSELEKTDFRNIVHSIPETNKKIYIPKNMEVRQ